MWLFLRGVAARRAALRLIGGPLPGGGGPGGRWPLWRLGVGLGLAATAIAVAGPERDSEERPPREAGFQRAVVRSRDLLQRLKDQVGVPGVVVGVSVDGREVWSEGVGYADLENRVLCSPETVLRIASISKSLTMVAVAKLWEEGKLDLDTAVQKYVPEFPEKEYEGEKVTITTRLLVSHLSGIRHYEKDISKAKEEKEKANRKASRTAASAEKEKEDKEPEKRDLAKGKQAKSGKKKREFEHEEYYLKDKFEHVIDSLNIFQNDPLFFKPDEHTINQTENCTN